MNILLKNGLLISPSDNINEIRDIAVIDGKPSLVIPDIKFDKVIDCKEKIVSPGLIDIHVHFRDPGFEYKEDINSVANAAAKSGVTTIVGMPNVKPAIDNKTVVNYVLNKGKETVVNVLTTGSATKSNAGETLAEIGEMKEEGICAVSDDAYPIQNANIMRRALEYSKNFDLPFMAHCEDKNFTKDAYMNEGYNASMLGLRPWPREAEEIMILRNALLAGLTGCHVHIQHLTTKGGVEAVKWAKGQGYPVSAETCPQYFTLTDDACLGYDTNAKCCPPLRRPEDIEAIVKGIKDNTIDIIATDHAPHAIEDKEVEFMSAAFGMTGLETALPLCIEELYIKNKVPIEVILRKYITEPAKLIGSKQDSFATQELADIIVFDPKAEIVVDKTKFLSKGKNTPFDGFKLHGEVELTIAKGKICYEK